MYELKENDYYKITNLISKLNHEIIWVSSILNNKQNCAKIFVDNLNTPRTAIIWHKCRDAIIIGDYNEEIFNNLKLLLNNEYTKSQQQFALSVLDKNWEQCIDKYILQNDSIKKYNRKYFKFNNEKYNTFKDSIKEQINKICFKTINLKNYNKLNFKYMPDRYWKSIEDFIKNGINYCAFYDKQYVSIAFSGFLANNKCDIGIETLEEFQGKGFASLVATKMIDYCISTNIEPIWGCRSDNISSSKVAKKLGFECIDMFAYYIKEDS